MVASIYNFSEALQIIEGSFATLRGFSVVRGCDGIAQLNRTTRFSEAKIEIDGRLYILAMPLCTSAIPSIEREISRLNQLTSLNLYKPIILHRELIFVNSQGETAYSDLILQQVPVRGSLEDVIGVESCETLLLSSVTLEGVLSENGIVLSNICAENIVYYQGEMFPLRYYYVGVGRGGDGNSFERLRDMICSAPEPSSMCDVVSQTYTPQSPFVGHLWVGNCFEGLVCVEDSDGYGYVDLMNRVVVTPQFVWADDFHEGRSVVETAAGMGLIDKDGRFVIEPIYEIVEYDYQGGTSQVRMQGQWATFSYMGEQLSEFAMRSVG